MQKKKIQYQTQVLNSKANKHETGPSDQKSNIRLNREGHKQKKFSKSTPTAVCLNLN